MTTASERVLSSMEIVVAEAEKNLLRLKQIESQTLAITEINRDTSKALDSLSKKLSLQAEEATQLKNRVLVLLEKRLTEEETTEPF